MTNEHQDGEREYHAILKDAYWVNDFRSPNIGGHIQGDTKGRFENGEWVSTSTVFEHLGDDIYRTRYSVYKVEWRDDRGEPSEPISGYTYTYTRARLDKAAVEPVPVDAGEVELWTHWQDGTESIAIGVNGSRPIAWVANDHHMAASNICYAHNDALAALTPVQPIGEESEAVKHLLAYQQADHDGVMVNVSRQAIHEVVDAYRAALAAMPARRGSDNVADVSEEEAVEIMARAVVDASGYGSDSPGYEVCVNGAAKDCRVAYHALKQRLGGKSEDQ